MSRRNIAVVLFSTLVLSAQAPAPRWRIGEAPPELKALISRADLMIAAIHDSVLRELTQAIDELGAAKAVDTCHIDSLLVTRRLAREGVKAGRTSDRLRNPTNAPPPWAADIVSAHAGQRARDIDGFAVDLGGTLGVLRAIAQRPVCANCHGPSDRLAKGVRAALDQRYPKDAATGFREGEIRGWFWVEIPKSAR